MNALYTAEETAFQLRAAGTRFLVTVPSLAERALEAAHAAGVEEVFTIGGAAGTTPFEELLAADGTPAPRPLIDPARRTAGRPNVPHAGSMAAAAPASRAAASSSSNGVVPVGAADREDLLDAGGVAASSARSASCGTVTRKRAPAMRSWNAASSAV